MSVPRFGQGDSCFSFGERILGSVVEQDIQQFFQICGIAVYKNIRFKTAFKLQMFFKKHRLKRKQGMLHRITEVDFGESGCICSLVCSCQLQHSLYEILHLTGHGKNVIR